MADPASIPAPNYTQIPNAIFDLMADKNANLKEAELRVILAIARKTFGWHKKRDKISLSQLVAMTAMSKTSVLTGLDAAVARGLVRKTPDDNDKRGGFFYELVVEEPNYQTSTKSELVQNLNQSNMLTRTSTKSELELVQNLNTQKKDKETKETSSTNGDGDFLKILIRDHNISSKKAREIAATGVDPETCYQSIRNCLDPNDPHSMGRLIIRLIDAPPEKGKPYENPNRKPLAQNGTGPRQPPKDAISREALAALARGETND